MSMRRLFSTRALERFTCVADMERAYARSVPRMFYDYCNSGSWTESTYRANVEDFSRLYLKQKVCVNIERRSLETTVLGQTVSMPVALAPVGFTGMQSANGEIKAARAAEKAGVPFVLSTMSINSIEDVAESTTRPFMFQLYMMRDREFMSQLIQRAKDAECSALVLTLDLQVLGQRHRDVKNGLSTPPRPTLTNVINLATKPRWCWEMLTEAKRWNFGNLTRARGVQNVNSLASWIKDQFDPSLSWSDVEWVREQWDGPIVLKGINDVDDAERARALGLASAIVVSNHGGRQLDGTCSSIRTLERIVDAVGSDVEVHFDGGIRTGQDVLKAVALGARTTYIGRAFTYGLGVGGEQGVGRVLDIIRSELDVTMAFTGRSDIRGVDRGVLFRRDELDSAHVIY